MREIVCTLAPNADIITMINAYQWCCYHPLTKPSTMFSDMSFGFRHPTIGRGRKIFNCTSASWFVDHFFVFLSIYRYVDMYLSIFFFYTFLFVFLFPTPLRSSGICCNDALFFCFASSLHLSNLPFLNIMSLFVGMANYHLLGYQMATFRACIGFCIIWLQYQWNCIYEAIHSWGHKQFKFCDDFTHSTGMVL